MKNIPKKYQCPYCKGSGENETYDDYNRDITQTHYESCEACSGTGDIRVMDL